MTVELLVVELKHRKLMQWGQRKSTINSIGCLFCNRLGFWQPGQFFIQLIGVRETVQSGTPFGWATLLVLMNRFIGGYNGFCLKQSVSHHRYKLSLCV